MIVKITEQPIICVLGRSSCTDAVGTGVDGFAVHMNYEVTRRATRWRMPGLRRSARTLPQRCQFCSEVTGMFVTGISGSW